MSERHGKIPEAFVCYEKDSSREASGVDPALEVYVSHLSVLLHDLFEKIYTPAETASRIYDVGGLTVANAKSRRAVERLCEKTNRTALVRLHRL